MSLAQHLSDSLPDGLPGLFHPWRSTCPFDAAGTPCGAPKNRLHRLERHLDCDPVLLLIGEACGYQGCRYSGIAFTSERLLLEGRIPRLEGESSRLSQRWKPFSEPSATIVWRTLGVLGVAERTVLWNALPLHPHQHERPWSNRTSRMDEISIGFEALHLILLHFRGATVVAVGRKAEAAIRLAGLPCHGAIRHPANGGAAAFAKGLGAVIGKEGLRFRTGCWSSP
jgi:hypothetical protein